MAVRIPTYEDRLTPSGSGVNTTARAPEVSDAIGRSIEKLGNAGMQLASTNMRIDIERENANAVTDVGSKLAEATAQFPNYLEDLAKSSKDGGMVYDKDGNPESLSQKYKSDFQSYAQSFIDGISNEKAKTYARQHLNQLYAHTYQKALATEAALSVQNREDNVTKAVTAWATQAARDGAQTPSLIEAAKSLIANSGFDEHTRNVHGITATKAIAEAAIQGELARNPSLTREALIQRFGVDPDAPPPAPGAPAAAGKTAGMSKPAGFNAAVNFTLVHEGSAYVAADSNGAPVKYGINGKYYPNEDIKGMTAERASEIYKKEYWDKIGGDKLAATNPGLATAAFDTAVMAGNEKAKKMLAQSGGDLNKFLDLRQQFLDGLVASNPDKYGKYQRGWTKRTNDLRDGDQTAAAPSAGVQVASAAPVSNVAIPSYLKTIVDNIDVNRLHPFINEATTEINRKNSVLRSQLTNVEADHDAAFATGRQVPNPLTKSQYVAAFGSVEGEQRYGQYLKNQQMGVDLNGMKLQTPEQIEATIKRYEPDPASPNFKLANERYTSVVQAAERIRTARAQDPIEYAAAVKMGDTKPINWNNGEETAAELRNRFGVATDMAQKYQAPFRMLSNTEAGNLVAGLNKMSTDQKLGFFAMVAKSVPDPDARRELFKQIAPDSPLSAIAGRLATMDAPGVAREKTWWRSEVAYNPTTVASMIMRGEELLNPGKAQKDQDGKPKQMLLPKEEDMRMKFVDGVGKTFPGQNEARDVAYQAVKAYYAAKLERLSDYSGNINSSAFNEALEAVTGGATSVNGTKVRRPWGMPETTFIDAAQAAFTKQTADLGLKGPDALFRNYSLENYRDGYKVISGGAYLKDNAGKDVVLDVTSSNPMKSSQPVVVPNAPAPAPKENAKKLHTK